MSVETEILPFDGIASDAKDGEYVVWITPLETNRKGINMEVAPARNWWSLVIRAQSYSECDIRLPGITVGALVLLFGAYALLDGVISVVGAWKSARVHERWGALASRRNRQYCRCGGDGSDSSNRRPSFHPLFRPAAWAFRRTGKSLYELTVLAKLFHYDCTHCL